MKRQVFWLGLWIVLVVGGCGQQSANVLEVASVFPPDGYHGFKQDDVIVLEFSEPVDLNSFLAAYRSTSDGLMPDQVRYGFEDGGKKIIIYPGKPLAYSPNDEYAYYGFELGTELADTNGGHLAEPLRVTFSTMRTLTTMVLSDADCDGSGSSVAVDDDGVVVIVGDSTSDLPILGFLGFPWPDEMDQVIAAKLRLVLVQKQNDPFADLGLMNVEPVDLGAAFDAPDLTSTALAPAISIDGSSWTVGEAVEYDVTDFAKLSRERGLDRLDLRLSFDLESDGDGAADVVYFYAREAETSVDNVKLPALELTYYGP